MENMEWETIKMEEMRKQPSKSEVIGSFIGMGMVGFCFGIGLMLAVKKNAYKMAEVTKEPQFEAAQAQQITKEPQRVMKEPQGEATHVQ